jgi:hypothetical protein
MPSNLERGQLREAVRVTISSIMRETGSVKTRQVAERVVRENGDLIKEFGSELATQAIARMAQVELRSWSAIIDGGQAQMVLPGVPGFVSDDLPATISVPDDDGDLMHVVLAKATVGQLRAYQRLLGSQILGVQRSHKAVSFIVDRLDGIGDGEFLVRALTPKSHQQAA